MTRSGKSCESGDSPGPRPSPPRPPPPGLQTSIARWPRRSDPILTVPRRDTRGAGSFQEVRSNMMKALVLCGGRGTRLRPLTYTLPKQLIPVANRPIVHYVMDHLAAAGIRDVGVIVAPETREQIENALATNPWGFALTYVLQPQPMGLAHALVVAREVIGSDPFLIYLRDHTPRSRLQPLMDLFLRERADAVVLLKEVSDPRHFGVAGVGGGGGARTHPGETAGPPPPPPPGRGVILFPPLSQAGPKKKTPP